MNSHMCVAIGVSTLFLVGCGTKSSPAPEPGAVSKSTIAEVPTGPSKVELSEPKAVFEPPRLVKFQVNYKFVEGGPHKSYLCEIKFPGTTNIGKKYMESWELKESGTIRDGIELQSLEPEATNFEIIFKEAEVPQDGYTLISNVGSGTVQQK